MILLIFPKGADGKLPGKNNGRLGCIKYFEALEHLNVSREKQKVILKRKQEMDVKELFAGCDVKAILLIAFGKSKN